MTWYFENKPMTEPSGDFIGFVYCITNLEDGRRYIGKKKLTRKKTSVKTVTLKNGTKKKKKISTQVESDWNDYYGSSEALKEDVEKLGTDKFRRDILMFCKKLGQLSYYEAKLQFQYEVLENPDKFYNSWISCRVRRNHL